ncbi:hypothetical protein HA466_0280070 [Hirschfeldia incana]|nr:hypothetical protein HA466_0280070 [Hirschfeldia incana]
MKGVRHLLVRKSIPNGLVFVGELPYGSKGEFSPKMDHLVCFLPGTLALGATKGLTKEKALAENLLSFEDLENLKLAEDLAKACFEMYEVTATGLAPEIAYFHTEEYSEGGLEGGNKSSVYAKDIIIKHADRHNLLRPETVESLFVLYRITKDTIYREQGWKIFEAFEKHTKVKSGGYTSLDDATEVPPHRRDKMETFFLGETLKYLYLLFGDDSVIPLDKFVFNTEAHPLPIRNKCYQLHRIGLDPDVNGYVMIFEKNPTTIKNFGIWLTYRSRTGYHNMYKEFRDTTLNEAVEQMYTEMASRHRVRFPCIQIIKTATVPAALCKRESKKQFHDSKIKFPSVFRPGRLDLPPGSS